MNNPFLNRLKEPSTWAGLSVLAALFGMPPGLIDAIAQITIGGLAAAAIALPEAGK